jgi:glycosyltransferase involved in cell wall biosynthesis
MSRVIYASPDLSGPVGGVRVLYRHVEVLTEAGYEAAVWLCGPPQDDVASWFTSPAQVVHGATLDLEEDDILVVPEPFVLAGQDPAPGCRKIIYNQNHFLTFVHAPWDDYPRWDPSPDVWVSSAAARDALRRLATLLPIERVDYIPLAIDTTLFRPLEPRANKVAWMPRKRSDEAGLLRALIAADPRFADVTVAVIDGWDERRTAEELGSTSVFVALGRDEGFGLPVAEALAAGCAVVGYPAGGGAELFRSPGTRVVDDCDTVALVDTVASVLADPPSPAERLASRSWIETRYSESTLVEALVRAVDGVRARPAAAGTAIHPFPAMQAVAAGP